MKTIFGIQEYEQTAFDLEVWYKKHNLRRGDSLLVTILNWETGHFRMKPESFRTRQQHETEAQQQVRRLPTIYSRHLKTRATNIFGGR